MYLVAVSPRGSCLVITLGQGEKSGEARLKERFIIAADSRFSLFNESFFTTIVLYRVTATKLANSVTDTFPIRWAYVFSFFLFASTNAPVHVYRMT
jgi:hypothetical protein